jgi:hypothetical protein
MKKFNYREVDQELMVPEVMNLVSTIHGYKGKQELFMKAKPDPRALNLCEDCI